MRTVRAIFIGVVGITLAWGAVAVAKTPCAKKGQPPLTPFSAPSFVASPPLIMSSAGDTTWVELHSSSNFCPGDPNMGHGGEATGGPGPTQTWCFEEGPGDSCGTLAPWNSRCFSHVDVRTLPSQVGINYWHLDTYRTDQRAYCGNYALWCGSGPLWQGRPVECGTWINPPGYADLWNCYVQLTLPDSFVVANGCTLYFDPRYDTECKYDYLYVDFWNGSAWVTTATFNATSNNPGGRCGNPATPNPDYFANTDVNRLVNCNWQARSDPNEPAFKKVIPPASLIITSGPKFRWRFTSDGAWSDADGSGNTDGAAFIDNVWVRGDTERFVDDFETGVLDTVRWSFPRPQGILDAWHIVHNPNRSEVRTCRTDSSYVYRARPEQGYPAGAAWRNGWYYRLMTPRIPLPSGGCIIQYDAFGCTYDYTCDYTMTKVRYHDSVLDQWCPWGGWFGAPPCGMSCYYWDIDDQENLWDWLSPSANADSMQFAWEIVDGSQPGESCRGKHQGTDYLVDNVSIGFYDYYANPTVFAARGIDLLHDSMLEEVDQAYNSFFGAYSADTIAKYSPPGRPNLPYYQQMYLDVIDKDSLASVEILGSVNSGGSWVARPMTLKVPYDPHNLPFGGEYYGTLKSGDFWPGTTDWPVGTVCWYYIKAVDNKDSVAYFPAKADPDHPGHTGTVSDYLEFTILPAFAETFTDPKILLVDGNGRTYYDYAPCLSRVDNKVLLERIYEETLTDAGYSYDRFDISGGGSNVHIHPTVLDYYDAVVWFTGPYFSNYLFDKKAQVAIRDYLADGGKVVLCGDRIAYNMEVVGEDSLGGEFLSGVMGTTYLEEAPAAFTYPYVYAVTGGSVNVFGSPVAVDLDTIVVYGECPYLKDFSYVLTNASPPAGYTAQQLMYIANPTVAAADEVIYTEYQNQGQCVYVNFDMCATVNHSRGYCDGDAATPAPDFSAGSYDGRVELLHVILDDIFGLPSSGGIAGTPSRETPVYQWALAQNAPNPCVSSTEIRFSVARSGRVRIRLYDVAGRLVKSLLDEHGEPGQHNVAWDGRDSNGGRVSSGVYFYIMDAAGYKATKKMLVVQ